MAKCKEITELPKKYYGVVFLITGDACVSRPCDTEEECINALKNVCRRVGDTIIATTYLKRDSQDLFDLFGHPRSRDLIEGKKYLK